MACAIQPINTFLDLSKSQMDRSDDIGRHVLMQGKRYQLC